MHSLQRQDLLKSITLLFSLLLLSCLVDRSACAPAVDDEDDVDGGCYYMFNHYGEGDRIYTNEPCLNCTCHNSMLMCYLRVCPFTKPIGQDCTVEKKPDQCCPVISCPEVPVSLVTPSGSTSTTASTTSLSSVTETTDLAIYERGCEIDGNYYPDGAQVETDPAKPCELCYCIRNRTACVMQECILHVEGCEPVFQPGVCCPVRYQCDYPMQLTDQSTMGSLITTTMKTLFSSTPSAGGCLRNNKYYEDGSMINSSSPCEHCYCMRGEIMCAVEECGRPLENEGGNCTAVAPPEGQCCPEQYTCEGDKPESLGEEMAETESSVSNNQASQSPESLMDATSDPETLKDTSETGEKTTVAPSDVKEEGLSEDNTSEGSSSTTTESNDETESLADVLHDDPEKVDDDADSENEADLEGSSTQNYLSVSHIPEITETPSTEKGVSENQRETTVGSIDGDTTVYQPNEDPNILSHEQQESSTVSAEISSSTSQDQSQKSSTTTMDDISSSPSSVDHEESSTVSSESSSPSEELQETSTASLEGSTPFSIESKPESSTVSSHETPSASEDDHQESSTAMVDSASLSQDDAVQESSTIPSSTSVSDSEQEKDSETEKEIGESYSTVLPETSTQSGVSDGDTPHSHEVQNEDSEISEIQQDHPEKLSEDAVNEESLVTNKDDKSTTEQPAKMPGTKIKDKEGEILGVVTVSSTPEPPESLFMHKNATTTALLEDSGTSTTPSTLPVGQDEDNEISDQDPEKHVHDIVDDSSHVTSDNTVTDKPADETDVTTKHSAVAMAEGTPDVSKPSDENTNEDNEMLSDAPASTEKPVEISEDPESNRQDGQETSTPESEQESQTSTTPKEITVKETEYPERTSTESPGVADGSEDDTKGTTSMQPDSTDIVSPSSTEPSVQDTTSEGISPSEDETQSVSETETSATPQNENDQNEKIAVTSSSTPSSSDVTVPESDSAVPHHDPSFPGDESDATTISSGSGDQEEESVRSTPAATSSEGGDQQTTTSPVYGVGEEMDKSVESTTSTEASKGAVAGESESSTTAASVVSPEMGDAPEVPHGSVDSDSSEDEQATTPSDTESSQEPVKNAVDSTETLPEQTTLAATQEGSSVSPQSEETSPTESSVDEISPTQAPEDSNKPQELLEDSTTKAPEASTSTETPAEETGADSSSNVTEGPSEQQEQGVVSTEMPSEPLDMKEIQTTSIVSSTENPVPEGEELANMQESTSSTESSAGDEDSPVHDAPQAGKDEDDETELTSTVAPQGVEGTASEASAEKELSSTPDSQKTDSVQEFNQDVVTEGTETPENFQSSTVAPEKATDLPPSGGVSSSEATSPPENVTENPTSSPVEKEQEVESTTRGATAESKPEEQEPTELISNEPESVAPPDTSDATAESETSPTTKSSVSDDSQTTLSPTVPEAFDVIPEAPSTSPEQGSSLIAGADMMQGDAETVTNAPDTQDTDSMPSSTDTSPEDASSSKPAAETEAPASGNADPEVGSMHMDSPDKVPVESGGEGVEQTTDSVVAPEEIAHVTDAPTTTPKTLDKETVAESEADQSTTISSIMDKETTRAPSSENVEDAAEVHGESTDSSVQEPEDIVHDAPAAATPDMALEHDGDVVTTVPSVSSVSNADQGTISSDSNTETSVSGTTDKPQSVDDQDAPEKISDAQGETSTPVSSHAPQSTVMPETEKEDGGQTIDDETTAHPLDLSEIPVSSSEKHSPQSSSTVGPVTSSEESSADVTTTATSISAGDAAVSSQEPVDELGTTTPTTIEKEDEEEGSQQTTVQPSAGLIKDEDATSSPESDDDKLSDEASSADEGSSSVSSTSPEGADNVSTEGEMDSKVTTAAPESVAAVTTTESEQQESSTEAQPPAKQSMTGGVDMGISIVTPDDMEAMNRVNATDASDEAAPSSEAGDGESSTTDSSSGVPGEGLCFVEGKSYENGSSIPPTTPCHIACACQNSIVHCLLVHCNPPPNVTGDCKPIYKTGQCCPDYDCENEDRVTVTVTPEPPFDSVSDENIHTVTPEHPTVDSTPASQDSEESSESSETANIGSGAVDEDTSISAEQETESGEDSESPAFDASGETDDGVSSTSESNVPQEVPSSSDAPASESESETDYSAEPDSPVSPSSSTEGPVDGATNQTSSVEGMPPGSHYPVTTTTTVTPSAAPWPYPTSTPPPSMMSAGACLFDGRVYMSAQQIPRDDPCDFCFCFRGDIICLQQSCPPPIPGCYEEPIPGFCCPRYECPVGNGNSTTQPPLFPPSYYHNQILNGLGAGTPNAPAISASISTGPGCEIQGEYYETGQVITSTSGPCLECRCGATGMMECDPRECQPEPMLRKMIAAITSRR